MSASVLTRTLDAGLAGLQRGRETSPDPAGLLPKLSVFPVLWSEPQGERILPQLTECDVSKPLHLQANKNEMDGPHKSDDIAVSQMAPFELAGGMSIGDEPIYSGVSGPSGGLRRGFAQ